MVKMLTLETSHQVLEESHSVEDCIYCMLASHRAHVLYVPVCTVGIYASRTSYELYLMLWKAADSGMHCLGVDTITPQMTCYCPANRNYF